jgi:hypothetical protein
MFKLENISPGNIQFKDNMTIILDPVNDGMIQDPVFDLPTASIESGDCFIINNDDIYLSFNDEQYIYDLMITTAHHFNNYAGDVKYDFPIFVKDEKCVVRFKSHGRIKTYLTNSKSKTDSTCFLNVEELKEFISEGLGFKLQFKICNNGTQFDIMSIEIEDIFDGQQDYLDPGMNHIDPINDPQSDFECESDDQETY